MLISKVVFCVLCSLIAFCLCDFGPHPDGGGAPPNGGEPPSDRGSPPSNRGSPPSDRESPPPNGISPDDCHHCLQPDERDNCHLKPCHCSPEDLKNMFIPDNPPRYPCPQPKINCVDVDTISLRWDITDDNNYYYIEYFMVGDTGEPNPRYSTIPTKCGYEIISYLQPSKLYQMTMYVVTIEPPKTICKSDVFSAETLSDYKPPLPVKTFSLASFNFVHVGFDANVVWEKNIDYPCSYNIELFDDNGNDELIPATDRVNIGYMKLKNLEFGAKYSASIVAFVDGVNGQHESGKTMIDIQVPSCYDGFKADSDKNCVPETPKNVTAEEYLIDSESSQKPIFNIQVNWDKPAFQPDFYTARLILYNQNVTSVIQNITGKETLMLFKDVFVTAEYEVILIACNRIGKSLPVTIHRHYSGPPFPLPPEKKWFQLELFFVIVCPLLLFILIMLFMINKYLTRRMKTKQENKFLKELAEKATPRTLSTVTILSAREMETDHWEIDVDMLTMTSLLGEGAFGLVRKGVYTKDNGENIEVAIKMLKDHATQDELRQFCQEIEIMKSVPPHPHLVSLIGCVSHDHPLLVVEFCPKGDLHAYLRKSWDKLTSMNSKKIEAENSPHYVTNKLYDVTESDMEDIPQPKDLLSFARQIILGMEFLSSLKVIHRDLAARNILVNSDKTIKISDFGLSRDVYYDNIYCKLTGGKLPIRWMSLESITHQIYTTQSDVWSFGILLWEIVTLGSTPYPGIPTQNILSLLRNGYRMEKPQNCSDKLYEIMCKCWKRSPLERPTFSELRVSFDTFLEEVSCYLSLNSNNMNNFMKDRYVEHRKVYD